MIIDQKHRRALRALHDERAFDIPDKWEPEHGFQPCPVKLDPLADEHEYPEADIEEMIRVLRIRGYMVAKRGKHKR